MVGVGCLGQPDAETHPCEQSAHYIYDAQRASRIAKPVTGRPQRQQQLRVRQGCQLCALPHKAEVDVAASRTVVAPPSIAAGLVPNPCGNGAVEEGEVCDDGNTADNDYCSADCLSVTGSCGDNAVQSNEDCDDGNAATETCAYGLLNCDVCDATCRLVNRATSFCSDNTTDTANGETVMMGIQRSNRATTVRWSVKSVMPTVD